MSEATRLEEEKSAGPGVRQRIGATLGMASELLSTRVEILGLEASQKAAHLARGLVSVALALVTGWIAMLLLAALLTALFTLLFGRVWAGVLATLLLYGGASATAALLGWKALSKVRPFDFPVTREELRKDWDMLSSRLRSGDGAGRPKPGEPAARTSTAPETLVDDVEARFRAGSE